MAPKRSRGNNGRFTSSGGSQTGGTGDVKPQILSITVAKPAGTGDYSIALFPVPRVVLGSADTATVMEILRVNWYIAIEDIADTSSTHYAYLSFRALRAQDETASITTFSDDIAELSSFAGVFYHRGTATEGAVVAKMPMTVDMTDQNGNGFLIGTDQIFATSAGVANTTTCTATAKILYRMVSVGIVEYVGMVQSQAV